MNRAIGNNRKIENLSKAKIIHKLAKSKKPGFTKTKKPDLINRTSETDFLIYKAKIAFSTYEKPLPKHQSFIILIRKVICGLKLIYLTMSLIESLIS